MSIAVPLGRRFVAVAALFLALLGVVTSSDDAAAAPVANGGFTTDVRLGAPDVVPGRSVTLSTDLTATATRRALVSVEVFDARRNSIYRMVWDDQPFTADQLRTYTTEWAVPTHRTLGVYAVEVRVFESGWRSLIHRSEQAASVNVVAAATAPTTPTPSPTTTAVATATVVATTTTSGPVAPTTPTIVAAPSGAVPVSNGGFTTDLRPAALQVSPGGSVSLATDVTAAANHRALVSTEVFDSRGASIFRKSWDFQDFTAGQLRTYTTSWVLPTTRPLGTYSIKVMVYAPAWASVLHTNSATPAVQVVASGTPVPTTLAPTTIIAATTTTTLPPTTTTVAGPTTTVPATTTTAVSTTTTTTTTTAPPIPGPAAPGFAFDMPSAAALDASERRVFAHYFTPYPISIDNKAAGVDYYTRNYNAPDGEGGNHAAYGGFFRQRPLPRPVSASTSWDLEDMKTEVRRASAAGIDGFTVDILGLTGIHWYRLQLLLDASAAVDPAFQIVLMPDANTSVVADPVVLADKLASIARHPSVYRLTDGRLVVSPFLAERRSAAWWANWMTLMDARGVKVAFVPTLLGYTANINAFDPISYGVSVWGGRSPATIGSLAALSADAHARGLVWMQPVALQDARPKTGVYDEANNTETLRTMWTTARTADADWVQIVTWNDYSESTEISPSSHTGSSPLDLNSYYLVAFKLGVPPIVRDQVVLSHRVHAHAARPTGGQTRLMGLRAGSSPGRDQVEVLTFMRQAARVEVSVGSHQYSYQAPAGVHAQLFPLALGAVAAQAVAGDGRRTVVTSPFVVTGQPVVQDLQYHFATSHVPR